MFDQRNPPPPPCTARSVAADFGLESEEYFSAHRQQKVVDARAAHLHWQHQLQVDFRSGRKPAWLPPSSFRRRYPAANPLENQIDLMPERVTNPAQSQKPRCNARTAGENQERQVVAVRLRNSEVGYCYGQRSRQRNE